jgi:hypothetical protein
MNFTDLYRYANSLTGDLVSVEDIRKKVVKEHPVIEAVEFWACNLDPQISLGHMILEMDRTSPYDSAFVSASIRFDRTRNTCWRRFVCCKELMHVFDSTLARTPTISRTMSRSCYLQTQNPPRISPGRAIILKRAYLTLICENLSSPRTQPAPLVPGLAKSGFHGRLPSGPARKCYAQHARSLRCPCLGLLWHR